MHDLFGPELEKWRYAEEKIRSILESYGYREIRTPALEKIEVFSHAVGEATDIVEKQMYTVLDRGTRPESKPEVMVLRPEGTAGFIRAVVEHQLAATGHPQRFYYYLPMYRYERPQKGRLRQFHQFGAELINDGSPEADAEIIFLLDRIYKAFALTEYEVRINSVGDEDCRPQYKQLLQDYFRPHLEALCEQCKARFERAPMRILDCKNETCQALAAKAPLLIDHLSPAAKAHHDKVRQRLQQAHVSFTDDPMIVRGLDYYSKTAFEFTSSLLGAQSALGGGGRYDGLSERYGKVSFPSVGWGMGMERLMLALEAKQALPDLTRGPDVFLAPIGEVAFDRFFPLSLRLKEKGIRAEMAYDATKGLKWLLKQADRHGARFALIVGEDEIAKDLANLRDMKAGTQSEISLHNLDAELERRLKDAN